MERQLPHPGHLVVVCHRQHLIVVTTDHYVAPEILVYITTKGLLSSATSFSKNLF